MNNRQAGRRRGRGGQRPPGSPNQRDSGNRIDNRARGNAAQLLEKYKNLARDAQMSGDRVNTEYYLQFADHYFRVLNESRARIEESRRPSNDMDEDEDGDFEEAAERDDRDQRDEGRRQQRAERGDRPERSGRPERAERQERGERPERGARGDRPHRAERRDEGEPGYPTDTASGVAPAAEDREADQLASASGPQGSDEGEAAPAPRRRGRPRREPVTAEAPAAIEADRLPPSLGLESAPDVEEAAPRRRRRPRAEAGEASGI